MSFPSATHLAAALASGTRHYRTLWCRHRLAVRSTWPTRICFHPSMFMSQRKRPATGQVATVAVVVAVLALLTWLVVRAHSPHRGEHYVAGVAGQHGSVSLGTEELKSQQRWPNDLAPKSDISDTCFYDTERHAVLVPIEVRGGGGGMTFRVTATVAKGSSGVDGDAVVKSAVSDVPFQGTMRSEGIWVRIPLDHATWNGGATNCRVSWTMTPGAWFSNDD
jgi:hypothetical protein